MTTEGMIGTSAAPYEPQPLEPMTVRFFDPGKSYSAIRAEMIVEIDRVLTRGDLILRDDLEIFEKNLATFVGKKHAIGVNSGTDALYLSLWALGIKPGDEVITASHTFVASAQVIAQLGATPVLVDCRDDLLMHPADVAEVLTQHTKAIMPVHITGAVANVEDMLPFDTPIVEDAAQALGAYGVGQGITQCYSFYPAKILGAYGDAGAITTDDDDLAEELRNLRHHYKKDYSKWGINSRLDNVQAAVLNIRMKHLKTAIVERHAVAQAYGRALAELPLILPQHSLGRVWQDYVIRFDSAHLRDAAYTFLKSRGVDTMKNEYPMPISKKPHAALIEAQSLRIPCNENLSTLEVMYVIEQIRNFFTK